MNINKYLLVSISILAIIGVFGVLPVFAQTQDKIIIDVPAELGAGSEFATSFSLDVSEKINAFEFRIGYNPQELSVVLLDDSMSEVDVWAEKTLVSPGLFILKGGFLLQRDGEVKIIAVRFEAKNTFAGKTLISTKMGSVFLADGLATRLNLPDSETAINFSTKEPPTLVTLSDNEPPVIENVKIIRDPFDDKNLILAFNARDAASGIKNTFARFRRGFLWSEWFLISSPAQVPGRAWAFELRAFDNAGNTSTYGGYISENIAGKAPYLLAVLIIGALIFTLRKIVKKW